MSGQGRKQYSREFREEAVRESYDSGKAVSEVARELGIPVTRLYKWRDLQKQTPNPSARAEAGELARLRRENARLREERDI
jgi:transposase-like protein